VCVCVCVCVCVRGDDELGHLTRCLCQIEHESTRAAYWRDWFIIFLVGRDWFIIFLVGRDWFIIFLVGL